MNKFATRIVNNHLTTKRFKLVKSDRGSLIRFTVSANDVGTTFWNNAPHKTVLSMRKTYKLEIIKLMDSFLFLITKL